MKEGDIFGLHYYEAGEGKPLVFLHAQGTDSTSFGSVIPKLAKQYHVYAVDCFGHGKSLHNPKLYTLRACAEAVSDFIREVVKEKCTILGHSSGGLIAAQIAAETNLCERLILEDPPFFSCEGERRFSTFNYVDLSTVCHRFLQSDETDFPLFYFENQYAWNFFPEKSRENVREKLTASARKFRTNHPEKNLKVPFWPKYALAGFVGMNNYDPRFGEAFYTNSFNDGLSHAEILKKISCETIFLKAKSAEDNGILMCALSEEDLAEVVRLTLCSVVRFDCGHGIHIEKKRDFLKVLLR
ncbi:MAG TPA: alpha/beta hydrolase [Methanocorpusculum sp.]|nr:alpha/beta hydrolase [Methanocorpusculum sp.]HJJ75125.1 alpha/beta hydrolase [Methanocorpusculum sp.]HJJ76466.1 alpha/beta hydrolase [Methanocorpusculum sp.]